MNRKSTAKMSYIKLEIVNPFGYDSCYTVFIKERGNDVSIETLKNMFKDDNVQEDKEELSAKYGIPIVEPAVIATRSSYQDFVEFRNNFNYSGKFDREVLVLIETEIKIKPKRDQYSSNKKWVKAVFRTSFVKHLEWDKVFGAQMFE